VCESGGRFYYPDRLVEALPSVSDFDRFVRQIEVVAAPPTGGEDTTTVIRFTGTDYAPESDSIGFVLFAFQGQNVIINRSYRPWESAADTFLLSNALEWLPKNAFIVLTGYRPSDSLQKRRSSDPDFGYYIDFRLKKWGAQKRIERLNPGAAYLLIGADSKVGAEPVERVVLGKPATHPGREIQE
jgi:hypothetical protein